jgi:tripartite-type tricarboxylate transporter receptor subunit TctC
MSMRILPRLLVATALAAPLLVRAQDYPTRAVTIVVPAAPGGGLDRVARLVADRLRERFGQPVIIDNRAGAGAIIGTQYVALAKPDGYTLLFGGTASYVINTRELRPTQAYDPSSFVPVSLVTTAPNVLVVNLKVPATSTQELIAYAKANPGKLNYGSQGEYSTQQLSVGLLTSMTGTDMVHIAYGGGAPALLALLGGQLDLMFTEISGVLPNIRAGKLRALAVGSPRRNVKLPDVPAMAEILAGFVSMTWQAVGAPPGTPGAIAEKVSAGIAEALKEPEVAKALADLSLDAVGSTPAELGSFMKEERERWSKVIRMIGAKKQ